MRSILRICCKFIKLWTPDFPILTEKCITRGLKRLPLSSTNASSPLSACIFPRHCKCYLFGILVSSLESHNMSKLSHEEEIAGLNVMLSTLTHKSFAGRLKTQRLFLLLQLVEKLHLPLRERLWDSASRFFSEFGVNVSVDKFLAVCCFCSGQCNRRHLHQICGLFGLLNTESCNWYYQICQL